MLLHDVKTDAIRKTILKFDDFSDEEKQPQEVQKSPESSLSMSD